ncbi:MAG: hypothetical protein JXA99_03740 [Candidatus Lokiarchaeota archaeon]|nr:hypothetical protein [Candidatus Lokiarchaeota archaeon]
MQVDNVSSSYTPPPAPEQSAPAPSVEEVPVSEAPVEAPNTNVNIDIIA